MHAWSHLIVAAQRCDPAASAKVSKKKRKRRKKTSSSKHHPPKLPTNLAADDDATLEQRMVRRIRSLLGPVKTHSPCVGECHYVCPRIEVHEKQGTVATRWPFEKPLPWMCGETFKHRVYSIYVCRMHNSVHLCTEHDCECEKILNSEHQYICPISKMQLSNADHEKIHHWKAMIKCQHTVHGNKSDPNRFSRNDDDRIVINSGGVAKNIYDEKLAADAEKVIYNLLLSDNRVSYELRRKKDAANEAMKKILKYRRTCKKNDQVICLMDEIHIFKNNIGDSNEYLHHLPHIRSKKKDIFDKYINDITHIWKMYNIEENGGSISFEQYCISCLYLMRRGVRKGSTYIIPKHPELMKLLPQVNNLLFFGIKSITPARKCLLKLLNHK